MTSRRREALGSGAVILMAVLVVTAVPVLAADPALEVVAEHTTDSDLTGASLTNASIQGTGTSASVDMTRYTGSYDAINDSGSGTISGSLELVGDLSTGGTRSSQWRLEPTEDIDQLDSIDVFIDHVDGSDYGFTVDVYLVEGEAPDGTAGEGTKIADNWDPDFSTGKQTIQLDTNVDLDASKTYTVEFVTNGGDDGDSTSDRIYLEMDDGSATSGTWHRVDGSFDGDQVGHIILHHKDSPQTATYLGPNVTADKIEACRADLILDNASATVTCQGWDGTSWNAAGSSTVSTSGVHQVSTTGSFSKWRVKVEFSRSDSVFTADLEDEATLFNAATPSVDNASASPDNTNVTSETVTLSIDVSDADFATSQGDSLTVEWYLDGSKVNTTSGVTSNGTVSVTESTPGGGGDHTWHVVVTDSYGDQTTSSTFSFGTPSTLFIYNESNVSQLVDNATVDLTFYFENGTGPEFSVTRSTSDGSLNMTGLPTDQPFVVAAEANGYLSRRVYIENLFKTQAIYLLPDTKQHVDRVYSLADYTGLFPPETTVLKIQRSLNGSWKTVEADFFGATGEFTAQLRYNTRHRLVILNTQTGERREVGYTTPLSDGSATIEVTAEGVKLVGVGVTVKFSPGINALPSADGTNVSVTVDNTSSTLNWWKVTMTHHNETTSTELFSVNSSSPGTQTGTLDLANKTGNVTVLVEWSTAAGSGTETETFRLRGLFTNQYSLLDTVLGFAGLIPDVHVENFKIGLAILVTVIVTTASAGVLQISSEAVGGVALLSLAGFAVIGFLPYDVVFASGVALVAFAGLGRKL